MLNEQIYNSALYWGAGIAATILAEVTVVQKLTATQIFVNTKNKPHTVKSIGALRKKLKREVSSIVAHISLDTSIKKATGEATIDMLYERILQNIWDTKAAKGAAVTLDDVEHQHVVKNYATDS